MQPKERISKASWLLVESTKDALKTNLHKAALSKQLKVEAKDLPFLLSIVEMSVDEGFHRGHKTFLRTVEKALDDECKSSLPVPTKTSEKKVVKAS